MTFHFGLVLVERYQAITATRATARAVAAVREMRMGLAPASKRADEVASAFMVCSRRISYSFERTLEERFDRSRITIKQLFSGSLQDYSRDHSLSWAPFDCRPP